MSADLKLTVEDRTWLHAMGTSDTEGPSHVVSMEQYQAVVESRDAAIRWIFLIRQNRRRMWARYCKLRKRLFRTEVAAVVILGGLILWKW